MSARKVTEWLHVNRNCRQRFVNIMTYPHHMIIKHFDNYILRISMYLSYAFYSLPKYLQLLRRIKSYIFWTPMYARPL